MMLAIAALLTKEDKATLANAQVVNVSFPNFFADLAYAYVQFASLTS
jgi:5-enolpyruvylshikimate-3-phosphate synthase